MPSHIRIGDMLVGAKLVTEEQLRQALATQKDSGRRLGDELVALGFVQEAQLTQILSNQLSIPWVSLYHIEFSRELLNLVPADVALREKLIPVYVRSVRKQGDTLFVAMDDPTNTDALEAVAQTSHLPVKPMIAPPNDIVNAIRVYYFGGRLPGEAAPQPAPPRRPPEATPATPVTRPEVAAPKEAPPDPPAPVPQPRPRPKKAARISDPPTQPKRGPRMVTLTLLDGTSVRLPAPGGRAGAGPTEAAAPEQTLTASDLVSALLARAQGADVSDVLPNRDWETLFATLLRLLIKKGLIADWEFVGELEKLRGDD